MWGWVSMASASLLSVVRAMLSACLYRAFGPELETFSPKYKGLGLGFRESLGVACLEDQGT